MHTQSDSFSLRPVAEDAWKALKPFRDAGAKSFHNFEIADVREKYVASCTANGLDEANEPRHADYEVNDFRLRVYEPRSEEQVGAATPAILFIHGGGWIMGNLETHHSAARRLAVLTGFPVIAVDYRLAPEAPYPAAHDDCRAAMRWLSEGKGTHGLNITEVCPLGDSAGGQLAAVVTNESSAAGLTIPLFAQVLLYPITDCSPERTESGDSYRRIEEGFPLSAETMRWFIRNYVPGDAEDIESILKSPSMSPLLHPLPEGLPPSLVITVDNDPLADEGTEYAAKLAKAGVDVEFRHLLGYHHGLFTSAGVIERGAEELARIAEWIRQQAETNS